MKTTTKYDTGKMQEDMISINCAVTNLDVLRCAAEENAINVPMLVDTLHFIIGSLELYCDRLSRSIDALIREEAAYV